MDRSLDEIISDRPQRGRGRGRGRPEGRRAQAPPPRAAPRREEYPRDGIRKNRYDDRTPIDSYEHPVASTRTAERATDNRSDWVHDRYVEDEDPRERGPSRLSYEHDRSDGARRPEENGTKLRVDNVHYDLTEGDLSELFQRIGPVTTVRMLYDRMDRSQGTAFVTYQDPRDARDAINEFNGCNANGQPIRITMLPTAPAAASKGTLFDRVERPTRSLFDRIHDAAGPNDDLREDVGGRRRRNRSHSPGRDREAPEHIDRYVPGVRRSRSPIKRRGTPREAGRRPGQRREDTESTRGGRGGRRGRIDEEGRPLVGGRPRKTAEELDAEMADYWGKPAGVQAQSTNTAAATVTNGSAADHVSAPVAPAADDDIDMIE